MMKKVLTAALLAAMCSGVYAASYELDASHSSIGFGVKHMVVSTTKGQFTDYTGGFAFEAGVPSSLKASAVIKVASVDTGNADRDEHLRGADFFDAGTRRRTITVVQQGGEGDAEAMHAPLPKAGRARGHGHGRQHDPAVGGAGRGGRPAGGL